MTNQDQLTTRRTFLKTSAAAGALLTAPAILSSNLFAGENNETLRIGLIGYGGRGSGAADQALNADKNVVLTAMGDGRLYRAGSHLGRRAQLQGTTRAG